MNFNVKEQNVVDFACENGRRDNFTLNGDNLIFLNTWRLRKRTCKGQQRDQGGTICLWGKLLSFKTTKKTLEILYYQFA